MTDQPRFDRAVGALYDAAADPARWPEALAGVSEWLGAVGAQILYWDNRTNSAAFSAQAGFSAEAERAYCERYGALDPKQPYYYALPVGDVFVCHRHFDQSFVDRSEFFQDFLIPNGGRWCMVGNLLREDDLAAMIGVHRNARMEGFEAPAVARFKRLVPHLQRAAQLQQRLGQVEAERRALRGTLDRLPFGVLLLDADRRAIAVNATAEQILRTGDGLALRHGRLVAARPSADAALQRLVLGATRTARGLGTESGGTLALPRPSGKRPLSALVAPLCPGAGETFADSPPFQPVVVLFLADPEREPRPSADLLRQLYGLTAREADLALNLATGRSPEAAAETMAITRETARTYLKRIFSKTDTARQTELVSLLLHSLGVGFLG